VTGSTHPAPRTRFVALVRNIIMLRRTTGFGPPKGGRSLSASRGEPLAKAKQAIMPSSRVAGLVPRLRNMVPTQDIAAHAALVRHIQVGLCLDIRARP
jgi:hypothetical protein